MTHTPDQPAWVMVPSSTFNALVRAYPGDPSLIGLTEDGQLASSPDQEAPEPVARLEEMARWLGEGDPGGEGSVLLSRSVAAEHASDLKAILAMLAASPSPAKVEGEPPAQGGGRP